MKYQFFKMQGCGNDFLFMDLMQSESMEMVQSEVQFLCDRHFGIGADGLVLLNSSEEAHAKWTFYNSDGSEAEMCGNAARCAIRYLHEKYFKEFDVIGIETKAGLIRGRILANTNHLVEITLMAKGDVKFQYEQMQIRTDKNIFDGYFINTGVPHFVMEVKDLFTYPIHRVGQLLVRHAAFGDTGSNITFFQSLVGPRIRSTTFERGVEAETYACGTGVAAAAIVYSELYLQTFPIEVNAPGGDLVIDVSPVSRMLVLQGPAEYVMDVETREIPHNFEKPALYGEKRKV